MRFASSWGQSAVRPGSGPGRPSPSSLAPEARPPGGKGPVVSCRLRITLPRDIWMQTFTASHPSVRLEVLDRLEVGRGLVLFEARVLSDLPHRWDEEIRRIPRVKDVELVESSDRSEVYRILWSGRTFVPLAKKLRLLRRFPFPVQDGVATWTVVGAEERVRQLLQSLSSAGVPYALDSVRRGPSVRLVSTLTARQHEILRRAVAEGYFEVPRHISLTRLAPKVGVATSTLSVTLALIEKKIVEAYAGSLDAHPVPD